MLVEKAESLEGRDLLLLDGTELVSAQQVKSLERWLRDLVLLFEKEDGVVT